jgi:uncharacterized protein
MLTRFSRLGALSAFLLALPVLAASAAPELHMVPMRDGASLATDVHLPAGEGPFPVVLARSVYGRDASLAAAFNASGTAFVIQDTRGRGDSEGMDMVFGTDGWGDLQDGGDTVAWVAEQPWCNGKIATFGPSALSITQMMLAPATDQVACQAFWVGTGRLYNSLSYQGGVWRKALCENWLTGQKAEHIIDLWKGHPTEDAFWAAHDGISQAPRANSPAVHVTGWWDIFQQGAIDYFNARQNNGGEGARGRQYLLVGPWLHGPVKEPGDLVLPDNFDDIDFNAHTIKFFGKYLLGNDGMFADEPAVRYYTLGDVGDPEAPGNEWREADAWPPFPTTPHVLFLNADGSLGETLPDAPDASLTYTYDPANPVPSKGGANLIIPAGPFDQRELGERDDVLRFVTEPLEAPVEITGRIGVWLHVSSDAPDTDFTAKLVDIYPDGREILMLDGIQRVKFREGFQAASPLPPGEVGLVAVDLWSISLIVNKGHRIGVHVSSSNHPRFEVNPNNGDDLPGEGDLRPARNTVHLGSVHPSALVLPVPVQASNSPNQ